MATIEQFQNMLMTAMREQSVQIETKIVETMTDQVVEKVVNKIKSTVEDEVAKAVKPLKETQEKTETELSKLASDLASLARRVSSQEEVMRGKEREEMVQRQGQQATSYANTLKAGSDIEYRTEVLSNEEEAVRKIFKTSNITLGLSPISKDMIEEEVNKQMTVTGLERDKVEAKVLKEAVKDFLIMEMKVKEDHFEKLGIVRIFAPKKVDWNTLYVVMENIEQADWVLYHSRYLPKVEKGQVQAKVLKYIPRQLFDRWNALQAYAYNIRKDSNWEVQTKIIHGKDDFHLQTRHKNGDIKLWSNDLKLPDNLPKIELSYMSREERSPTSAPGRVQYKTMKRKTRPSSGSSSSGSPPPKQTNNQVDDSVQIAPESGLLSKPNISHIVESVHPPGSPGNGIIKSILECSSI